DRMTIATPRERGGTWRRAASSRRLRGPQGGRAVVAHDRAIPHEVCWLGTYVCRTPWYVRRADAERSQSRSCSSVTGCAIQCTSPNGEPPIANQQRVANVCCVEPDRAQDARQHVPAVRRGLPRASPERAAPSPDLAALGRYGGNMHRSAA